MLKSTPLKIQGRREAGSRKEVTGVNEHGTTLIELLLAALIIFAVGVALILPSVSAWYPIGF